MIALVLVAIVIAISLPKKQISSLELATDRIILYLQYTRYLAFLDNKFRVDDHEWEKKRWSVKFQRCSDPLDGLYFVVFSDESGGTAAFKKKDTMKDPLNGKYLYGQGQCEPRMDESKNIYLTKEYGIQNVTISCNNTSTIGQIGFGYDGHVYSSLGQNIVQIQEPCLVTFEDQYHKRSTIMIEPRTGFVHKL